MKEGRPWMNAPNWTQLDLCVGKFQLIDVPLGVSEKKHIVKPDAFVLVQRCSYRGGYVQEIWGDDVEKKPFQRSHRRKEISAIFGKRLFDMKAGETLKDVCTGLEYMVHEKSKKDLKILEIKSTV